MDIKAEGRVTWEIHMIRGDATNSNVMHSCKAHVADVSSLFELGDVDEDILDMTLPPKEVHTIFPDLIKIGDSCDGPMQRAIFLKQLQSVGVGTWQNREARPNHMRVWIFTSDQGPDQVAASKLMNADVAESQWDIMITHWCLAHVFHLMALWVSATNPQRRITHAYPCQADH